MKRLLEIIIAVAALPAIILALCCGYEVEIELNKSMRLREK